MAHKAINNDLRQAWAVATKNYLDVKPALASKKWVAIDISDLVEENRAIRF
jgi:hypothetical protein